MLSLIRSVHHVRSAARRATIARQTWSRLWRIKNIEHAVAKLRNEERNAVSHFLQATNVRASPSVAYARRALNNSCCALSMPSVKRLVCSQETALNP